MPFQMVAQQQPAAGGGPEMETDGRCCCCFVSLKKTELIDIVGDVRMFVFVCLTMTFLWF